MRPCTLAFAPTRRDGEGRDRCEGGETEIGDTGLGLLSILNQDVSLRRDNVRLTHLILARANAPLSDPHE